MHNLTEVIILKHIYSIIKHNFSTFMGIIFSAAASAVFVPVMYSVRGTGAVGGEFFAIILIGLLGGYAASSLCAKMQKNSKHHARRCTARKTADAKIISFNDVRNRRNITDTAA